MKKNWVVLIMLSIFLLSGCGGRSFKTVKIGHLEQDDNDVNGPEPIEWIVLDQNDNGTLLLSKYLLCKQAFHSDRFANDIRWYNSSIRQWLNNDFYNECFSDTEKTKINTVTVINEDNITQNVDGGEDTEDKIFLLSVDECFKYFDFNCIFEENGRVYRGYSEELLAEPIPSLRKYAYTLEINDFETINSKMRSQGGKKYSPKHNKKNVNNWWLRTPAMYDDTGYGSGRACRVHLYGIVGEDCSYGIASNEGVRPAMYIKK